MSTAADLATNHPSSSWSTPMRKTLTAIVAALFLILTPATAAMADKAAEFDVTTEGITLHEALVFGTQHNIHVDYYDTDGYLQRVRGNDLAGPADGSSVTWADLGLADGALVTFVHVTGHGKWTLPKGVPVGPKPQPGHDAKSESEVRTETEYLCPAGEAAYGHVTVYENTYRVDYERTSSITWDGTDWVETWSDWTVTGEELTDTAEVSTRMMTDAERDACGLPPTGAPVGLAVGAAGLLVLAGAGMAVARRRSIR